MCLVNKFVVIIIIIIIIIIVIIIIIFVRVIYIINIFIFNNRTRKIEGQYKNWKQLLLFSIHSKIKSQTNCISQWNSLLQCVAYSLLEWQKRMKSLYIVLVLERRNKDACILRWYFICSWLNCMVITAESSWSDGISLAKNVPITFCS